MLKFIEFQQKCNIHRLEMVVPGPASVVSKEYVMYHRKSVTGEGRKMRELGKSQHSKRKVTCYVTDKNARILALHNKWMCCSSVTRKLFPEFFSSLRSFHLFSRPRSHKKLFRSNLRFVYMASEPPVKRSKKEIAEKSDNNGGDESILATYITMRQNVCKSVADFKFDKKRVRLITSNADMPETCKGIAYWMWREQRVQDNWALLYAQRMALKQEVPLLVCFCLPSKYLDAAYRQYNFMITGLQEVEKELTELNIPFHMLLGEPDKVLPDFIKTKEIGGVVTDFTPMRTPLKWLENAAKKLPKNVPVCQVDGHNIVPCWQASPKLEYGARTIRPKIQGQLKQFLTEFPPVIKHPYATKDAAKTVDWKAVDEFIDVDRSVKEVNWAKPGTKAGLEMLETFCHERLEYFATDRNNPTKSALSNLSPWFHAGHISVQRAILRVREFRSKSKKSVEAFIEEAVVRRELADNFCFYNLDHYDSIKGTNAWAQKTLQDHAQDKREYLYTREQFEKGQTHDDLWNATQLQMVNEGKMHGFLRMYWAKKILEWTASPEEALQVSLYLNDKFELDGNDPNGYVGCMWSVCGIHDQGWGERPVFGKIRYMNYNGCKRKFNVAEFVRKYGSGKEKNSVAPTKSVLNRKRKASSNETHIVQSEGITVEESDEDKNNSSKEQQNSNSDIDDCDAGDLRLNKDLVPRHSTKASSNETHTVQSVDITDGGSDQDKNNSKKGQQKSNSDIDDCISVGVDLHLNKVLEPRHSIKTSSNETHIVQSVSITDEESGEEENNGSEEQQKDNSGFGDCGAGRRIANIQNKRRQESQRKTSNKKRKGKTEAEKLQDSLVGAFRPCRSGRRNPDLSSESCKGKNQAHLDPS